MKLSDTNEGYKNIQQYSMHTRSTNIRAETHTVPHKNNCILRTNIHSSIRFPYITFMGIRGSPNPIICTYVSGDEKAQTWHEYHSRPAAQPNKLCPSSLNSCFAVLPVLMSVVNRWAQLSPLALIGRRRLNDVHYHLSYMPSFVVWWPRHQQHIWRQLPLSSVCARRRHGGDGIGQDNSA